MRQPQKGDVIHVPVTVTGGAFAGECFISFDSIDGPISGFINSSQVIRQDGESYIPAQVLEVESDRMAVRFHGSFFTTTGLAHISTTASYERAA
jgi:hypothetical protein